MGAKIRSNRARRARRRAHERASKTYLLNEASGGTLQASGSEIGDHFKRSSQFKDGNGSKVKSYSYTSNVRGAAGGRREREKSGSGEMEVITLESSDEETASELEEEAQILRTIQQQIGRK